jgi:hypothetical protein
MPNRILREGINDSEPVNRLSDEGEIFYRRLINIVDDFGRTEADAALLRPRLFARKLDQWSEERIERCLAECSAILNSDGDPLTRVYTAGRKRYLQISKFGQRLRCAKSKHPAPPEANPPKAANAQLLKAPDYGSQPSAGTVEPILECRIDSTMPTAGDVAPARTVPISSPPRRDRWQGDVEYHPFVEVYRNSGAALIDADFSDAYFAWVKLDFEQRAKAIESVSTYTKSGAWSDPAMIMRPRKFLERHEWERAITKPKPNNKQAQFVEGLL